jgi:hypothetical protein
MFPLARARRDLCNDFMTNERNVGPAALTTALAATAILSAFSLAAPGLADRVFAEDGVIETASALAFAAASAMAACRLRAGSGPRGWLAFAILAGLFGFLDELSFGERMLGFQPPVVGGVKIDAVHDLLELARSVAVAAMPGDAVLLAGLIGGLALLLVPIAWYARRVPVRGMACLVGAIGCVLAAQVLDLKLSYLRHPMVSATNMEETLELVAGLLLAAFAATVMRSLPAPSDHAMSGSLDHGS